MKRTLPFLPALVILAAALAWYWQGARQESRLRAAWSTGAERPEGTVALPPETPPETHTGDVLAIPPTLLTADTERFFTHWIAEVLAEEQRLADAGNDTGEKFGPCLEYLARLSPKDLLAICLTARGTVSLMENGMNVRSPPEEIKALLVHNAYRYLVGG